MEQTVEKLYREYQRVCQNPELMSNLWGKVYHSRRVSPEKYTQTSPTDTMMYLLQACINVATFDYEKLANDGSTKHPMLERLEKLEEQMKDVPL